MSFQRFVPAGICDILFAFLDAKVRYNNKGKILPLRMQIISSKVDPYLYGKQNENGRVPQKQILIVKDLLSCW